MTEHHPEMNTGFASRHELEELHDCLDELLARLDLVNYQLSLCVEALESLADSQG